MTNQVAVCAPPDLPNDLKRELQVVLSRLQDLDSSNFPPALRARLEAHQRALALGLRPADKSQIISVLAQLSFMARRAITDDEAEALTGIELDVLRELPLFAIEGAAQAFKRGEKGDAHFRPMPGELRQEALRLLAPRRGELHLIRQALEAARRPAKERVRPEKFAELMERVRRAPQTACEVNAAGKPKVDPGVSAEEALEALAGAYAARPVRLSGEALALMRRSNSDTAAALRAETAE